MIKNLQECILLRKEKVEKTLASSPIAGKNLLEPLKSFAKEHNLPFNILEDTNVINAPELHRHEGDLWQCLEGQVQFTYGGELVEPRAKINNDGAVDEREWKAKEIRGGTEVTLNPGDWLWIPAGQPHQHKCPAGTARLMIIKVPLKS